MPMDSNASGYIAGSCRCLHGSASDSRGTAACTGIVARSVRGAAALSGADRPSQLRRRRASIRERLLLARPHDGLCDPGIDAGFSTTAEGLLHTPVFPRMERE